MDWENFPSVHEPEIRLKEYQRAKAEDKEWWEVQRIKFKLDLGEELTTGEKNTLAYSVYGTAAGCHCGGHK